MKFRSYFFLSHSSKDIEKVRKIRNLIEALNCNPILFYLKCLDNDDPSGQDEIELKSLLYREIASREKVILCKSQNTEPPNETKWIAWEKETVNQLAGKLKPFEVDLEQPDYLDKVKHIVNKFANILLASTYEVSPYYSLEIEEYLKISLKSYGITISTLRECGDVRDDLTLKMGQRAKDMVKDMISKCNLEDKALVLMLMSGKEEVTTFMQMAYSYCQRANCYYIPIKVDEKPSSRDLKEIEDKILDFLLS